MAAKETDARPTPYAGDPVVDPTENVKALSEAANKRQDDLREADSILADEKIRCVKEIVELRAAHKIEVDGLRDSYEEKLRNAEAKRIDAIRAVDVNAVSVASQRASDQAAVLATQVAQSADALRALVATTQSTLAAAQQQQATQFSDRLTKVEQAQYAGGGKAAGVGAIGALVVGVVVVVGVIFGIITFFANNKGAPIYVQAPPGTSLPVTPPQAVPR